MDRIGFTLLLLLVTIAGCTKGYNPEPPAVRPIPTPTLTIEGLHALYRNQPLTIGDEVVVSGVVTTSDRAGNFYHSLCIEQAGYGLELLIGGEALHSRYPIGCRLAVRLKGLTLATERGVLQAGVAAPAYAYSSLEQLVGQPRIDEHLFPYDEPPTNPHAQQCTIEELTPAHCGRLVVITGLRSDPLAEEEPTLAGYHRFTDALNQSLHLYVSSYARFSAEPLPAGEVALRGILQHLSSGDHSGYVIKPRDETDLLL